MLIACRWSPGYARDGDSLLFNGIRKEIGTNIDNGHMKESCARVCNILHKITSLSLSSIAATTLSRLPSVSSDERRYARSSIMIFNVFIRRVENPQRADKSALGAINRPLQ